MAEFLHTWILPSSGYRYIDPRGRAAARLMNRRAVLASSAEILMISGHRVTTEQTH